MNRMTMNDTDRQMRKVQAEDIQVPQGWQRSVVALLEKQNT